MKRIRLSPATTARDELLDGIVAAANPIQDTALRAAGFADAFETLERRILARTPRGARRRLSPRLAVALVVAVTVFGVTAALASMLTTHTGFFPSKAGTENDRTEFLRTDVPDFPPLVARLVNGIPFPPGDSAR